MCMVFMNYSEDKIKNEILKEIKEKSFFPKSSDYNLFLKILVNYHTTFKKENTSVSIIENKNCNVVYISKKIKRELHIRKLLRD